MEDQKTRNWDLDGIDSISESTSNDKHSASEQESQIPIAPLIDPNAINTGAILGPVVIFYGPRQVGKTVTLIRISKFVKKNAGINIRVNPGFRTDNAYPTTINTFNELLDKENKYSPQRTGNIDFLLLDYYENGKLYCQLLEAPGEHFFDENDQREPNKPYVAYFENIRLRDYKKVYVLFFEDNMFGNPDLRERYASKAATLINSLNPKRDRVLVLYNKVDEIPAITVRGKANVETLKNHIFSNPEYNEFKVAIKKSSLKHIYFVPFSSGSFPEIQGSDKVRWVLGLDDYPKIFWSSIRSSLDKKWRLFG